MQSTQKVNHSTPLRSIRAGGKMESLNKNEIEVIKLIRSAAYQSIVIKINGGKIVLLRKEITILPDPGEENCHANR